MPVEADAQTLLGNRAEPLREWFTASLGPGTPHDVHFRAGYSFGRTRFYQAAFSHNTDFNFFGGPTGHVSGVSVSRGWRTASKYVVLAGFAGPAFVWGQQRRDATTRRYYTAGLDLNGQLYLRPFAGVGTQAGIPLGGLGIGIEVQANANPVQSAAGIGIGLYLGTRL